MKVSKDFDVREFVPPVIWNQYGDKSIWFIQESLVVMMQFIRDYFDASVTINNWHYWKSGMPGPYTQRGYRIPSGIGAKYSQHKRGTACDFTVQGIIPNDVRAVILRNIKSFMDVKLTTLEHGDDAPTWVHADQRWTGMDHILIVRG